MNWQQTQDTFIQIKEELGQPRVALLTEGEFSKINGTVRKDGPYAVSLDTTPASIRVIWRGKSPKVVSRAIYQAIGEVLWPKLGHDKIVWYGIVMSQQKDLPYRVPVPEGGKTRSALLKLTIAQARRKAS